MRVEKLSNKAMCAHALDNVAKAADRSRRHGDCVSSRAACNCHLLLHWRVVVALQFRRRPCQQRFVDHLRHFSGPSMPNGPAHALH